MSAVGFSLRMVILLWLPAKKCLSLLDDISPCSLRSTISWPHSLRAFFVFQMFHLMPTPQGSFYVLNDIFRLNYAWTQHGLLVHKKYLLLGCQDYTIHMIATVWCLNFKLHLVFFFFGRLRLSSCSVLRLLKNMDSFMVIGWSENRSSVYSCIKSLIELFYLFSFGQKFGRVKLWSFEIHVAKLSNFGFASIASLFSLPFNAAG